jgi:uncharacterized protein YndB with AHSA1/START domain
MLKTILIAVAVVVVGLVAVISMQPATFLVSRTTSIAAPPAEVFALVNDFHKWENWSPWAKLDPAMKSTFEGAPSGAGAVYAWSGNDKVGEGRQTILESRAGELVRVKLEFVKPFASVAETEFEFSGAGNGTTVTWVMKGENDFVSKGFCLFMGGMEKMIGPDFAKGLAQLKSLAESAAQK